MTFSKFEEIPKSTNPGFDKKVGRVCDKYRDL